MFENLQEKLQRAFKSLRGQAKLTEENIDEALREIRLALLEADVNFKVVKQLIDQIRAKAVGQEVHDRAVSPGEQVIKILRDSELVEDSRQRHGASEVCIAAADGCPHGWAAGLRQDHNIWQAGELVQDRRAPSAAGFSGRVPPCGARAIESSRAGGQEPHLRRHGWRGQYRDSRAVGERGASRSHCFGLRRPHRRYCGPLKYIDDQLMDDDAVAEEAAESRPEILFVADAMTGQDAVRSAEEFHKKLSLTGVILTKMDGDARGGAALSIRQVTGQPIKFIGVGEKYDALEPFHPDRIVSRILGMGDILSLIERAESQIDKKKAQEMATKALTGDGFSLEDFRDQLRQVKKMGSMKSLMGMLPSIGPFSGLQKAADNIDEKQINRVEAIINSMTSHEAQSS